MLRKKSEKKHRWEGKWKCRKTGRDYNEKKKKIWRIESRPRGECCGCFRQVWGNGSDYNYVKAVEEVTSGPSEIVSRRDKKTLEKCLLCACQCQSFVYLSHIFSLVWHKAAMDGCSIKIELFRNIHCSTVI